MINTIVWCLITVTLQGSKEETAAKGKVIFESSSYYVIDFLQYARQQQYEGAYYNYTVDKDKCSTEKELQ